MREINKPRKCNIQHRDYFIIFYEYLQIFSNNYQWSLTFKNCRSLHCRPVTCNIKHRLSSSAARLCSGLCGPVDCSTPGPPVGSLLKLTSVNSVMPSNHLILCRPLLLPPSVFLSITIFSTESVLHIRWPKYWSFSFSICPSDEYSGLISFRMDWLDLLAVQGTLGNSLTPQFKSINSSVLSFLYSPTLISIHDYWKNHDFD